MEKLGTLERVAIRDAWASEPAHFTPWLATENKLELLAKAIGIGLELIDMEVQVGAYRLDILAKESGTENMVAIENQYGPTDHSHLGQLLTYAAGVGAEGAGAKTIIWIAESFREEHRNALDWLNKSTESAIRYFGVEIELWKIGNSLAAPKFNLVSKPNPWQKELSQKTSAPTGLSKLYQEFWAEFIDCYESTQLDLRYGAPAQHWIGVFAIRSGVGINLTISNKFESMTCQLWLESPDAKQLFDKLSVRSEELKAKLGADLVFDRKDLKKPCAIYLEHACDITDRKQWPVIRDWLKANAEAFITIFPSLVKELDS